MTEEQLQIMCTRYIRREIKALAPFYIHVANENIRDIECEKEKGAIFGFPDIFIFLPKNGFRGFMCELKTEGGRLRSMQQKCLQGYRALGFYTCVAFSFDEFRLHIHNYLYNGGYTNQQNPYPNHPDAFRRAMRKATQAIVSLFCWRTNRRNFRQGNKIGFCNVPNDA